MRSTRRSPPSRRAKFATLLEDVEKRIVEGTHPE